MAKKTIEEKLAETIVDATSNHFFNPAITASLLANETNYTQGKIMELIKWIIRYQQQKMVEEWDKGITTENLLLADALNDTLNQLDK